MVLLINGEAVTKKIPGPPPLKVYKTVRLSKEDERLIKKAAKRLRPSVNPGKFMRDAALEKARLSQ